MQDSPTRTATKPWNARTADDREPPRERLRVLVLGANVWVIGVLWPLLGSRPTGVFELSLALASPVPLLLGGTRSAARAGFRPFLWLVAFPSALAATLALRPERSNHEAFGVVGLLLLWASLCAYGTFAIMAVTPRAPSLATTQRALGNGAWDARPAPSHSRERSLIAAASLGAVALCLVAPRLGDPDELERVFGQSATSAAVLHAVVGGSLAVSVLAVYLGNGLRAAAGPEVRSERTLRAGMYLFLALVSAVTYVLIQP